MSGPRRKPARSRDMMSVYPPKSVGPALGGYRSVPFSQALRIAAHVLAEANLLVAKKLTPKEWDYVYQSMLGRSVDPEASRPGGYLAEVVQATHTHYGMGSELGGKDPASAVEALAKKLQDLDYLQSWAVIISCTWRQEMEPESAAAEWWTLRHRASKDA